jgi:hypothetical protein
MFMACSTSEKLAVSDTSITNEVKTSSNPICFNHSVLVLESTTYEAVVNSEFINQFAFSYEKQLKGWKGFYMFGKTNYLELFHPKSFEDHEEEEGVIWICHASLKPNHLEQLNKQKFDFIEYESEDELDYLNLVMNDSVDPTISTWEMGKNYYESWTKKEYHDSIEFLPVDYNSQKDTDSSSNYLMNDVYGIGLSLNPDDSLKVISYLKEIGYESFSEFNGNTRISNNDQFIELLVSEETKSPTINRYYIKLNQSIEQHTEVIGNSRIECNGKLAIWYFEIK